MRFQLYESHGVTATGLKSGQKYILYLILFEAGQTTIFRLQSKICEKCMKTFKLPRLGLV